MKSRKLEPCSFIRTVPFYKADKMIKTMGSSKTCFISGLFIKAAMIFVFLGLGYVDNAGGVDLSNGKGYWFCVSSDGHYASITYDKQCPSDFHLEQGGGKTSVPARNEFGSLSSPNSSGEDGTVSVGGAGLSDGSKPLLMRTDGEPLGSGYNQVQDSPNPSTDKTVESSGWPVSWTKDKSNDEKPNSFIEEFQNILGIGKKTADSQGTKSATRNLKGVDVQSNKSDCKQVGYEECAKNWGGLRNLAVLAKSGDAQAKEILQAAYKKNKAQFWTKQDKQNAKKLAKKMAEDEYIQYAAKNWNKLNEKDQQTTFKKVSEYYYKILNGKEVTSADIKIPKFVKFDNPYTLGRYCDKYGYNNVVNNGGCGDGEKKMDPGTIELSSKRRSFADEMGTFVHEYTHANNNEYLLKTLYDERMVKDEEKQLKRGSPAYLKAVWLDVNANYYCQDPHKCYRRQPTEVVAFNYGGITERWLRFHLIMNGLEEVREDVRGVFGIKNY